MQQIRRIIRIAGVLAAVVFLFGGLAVTKARAATYLVNDLGDAADILPGDGICDASAAAGGQCTLRAAIQEAENPGGDEIHFTLTGTINLGSPLPMITAPGLTINGPGANALTVSGNNTFRLLNILL